VTNLILSSNFSDNKLFGVGEASLHDSTIEIVVEPNTQATLLRGVNKVILLRGGNYQQTVNGNVILGDVYVLENDRGKLTIKVENKETKHETNIYIDNAKIIDATSNKRRTTLSVGILILILLILSVFFGLKQKKLNEFNLNSEAKLKIAIENYELKTRESFIKSKEIAESLKSDGYKNEKLEDLIKKINESESELLGETKVETKELLDLTLQVNGFNGRHISVTDKVLFVYDENEKNIIKLDINGKSASIAAKKELLDGTKGIGAYDGRLFTLNDDGIYEISSERKKLIDADWGNSLIYLYSANIYMVDKDNNKIYRFSGNGKQFGDKSEWLAPGVEADFSKVIDMTIDGSIWIVTSSGKIIKYTNGNPNQILLGGIVKQIENPTAIYTNENLKYAYVLDSSEGRVIVLEKNGQFKIQYVAEEIKNAKDLVISEDEKKLILLTGPKLSYFELNN